MWLTTACRGLLLASLVFLLTGCAAGLDPALKDSDNVRDGRFVNLDADSAPGFFDTMRYGVSGSGRGWERQITPPPSRNLEPRLRESQVSVLMVNHATVLIRYAGLNILTNPMWSDRAGPTALPGTRRHQAPGIRFEDLPPIDVVLINHNHYHHLDPETLRRLDQTHAPLIIVPLGNGRYLEDLSRSRPRELDWWESYAVDDDVEITAVPARHWSLGRGGKRNTALWSGFAIRAGDDWIYVAGSTGVGSHFDLIRERLGPPLLALLPIGGYLPRSVMRDYYMAPWEALEVHRQLEAGHSLAVQWGTFPIGNETQRQPARVLQDLKAAEGPDGDRFWILENGDSQTITRPGAGTSD